MFRTGASILAGQVLANQRLAPVQRLANQRLAKAGVWWAELVFDYLRARARVWRQRLIDLASPPADTLAGLCLQLINKLTNHANLAAVVPPLIRFPDRHIYARVPPGMRSYPSAQVALVHMDRSAYPGDPGQMTVWKPG